MSSLAYQVPREFAIDKPSNKGNKESQGKGCLIGFFNNLRLHQMALIVFKKL